MAKKDVKDNYEHVKEVVQEKAQEVDKFVKKKPYKAIGIVAGVSAALGALAGFLLRKKRKE